ncbi:MAG: T9SS type A sorting domain-containing protein [Bacteroidales bacterium]|nr:T9SS type A sorting domain-containing protein [Bacteroidales bacterium]
MKKLLHGLIFLLFFFSFSSSFRTYSQCSSGEIEISIVVQTDDWGSEVTWELTGPEGSPEYIKGGPYPDGSEQLDEQTVCVPEGAELVFRINDSSNDGICAGDDNGYYTVSAYDFVYAQGCDYGSGETTTFFAVPPPNTNLIFDELLIPKYVEYGDIPIEGIIRNYGVNTITSVDVNWTVDNGTINTYTINDLNIASNETDTFSHATPWNTADSLVFYELKVWTSNPNGVADDVPENDILELEIYVLDDVAQRLVLIEHFTNASCGPCVSQNPILDALINEPGNLEKVSHLAYHTSWPGIDPMYTFNLDKGQGNARVSYYSVSGVPNALVGGNKFQGSPVNVTTEMIVAEYERPGLFDINIEPAFVSDSKIKVELDITSLAEFKEGTLKAHVVLVQDMEYESTPGTLVNGEKSFPDVMRYMISGLEGVDIGLPKYGDVFSTILSQELDIAVIKDFEIIVFIQDDNNKNILMATSVVANITPPFVSISPFDGEKDIILDTDIFITFQESVRLIDNTEIVDPTSLITFKKNNASGEDVSFTASINEEKTEIEITPDNVLDITQDYYVALSNSVEDYNDLAIEEQSAIFTTMSIPTVEFSIENGAIDIVEDSILITFSEPLRLINNDPITEPASLITIKLDNSSGENVSFTARVNEDNTMISVVPDTYLDPQQTYYINIGALVENRFDYAIEETNISFTTGEYPSVEIYTFPDNEAVNVSRDGDIRITFSMEVRLLNDDPITDPSSLVSLKKNDQSGEDVPFTASINSINKSITIDPDAALGAEQVYCVSIEVLVENKYNMAIEDTSITFTTGVLSGIHENEISIDLKIYPNPFKDELNLSYFSDETGKSVIEIYNQTGMLVKTQTQESYIGKQLIEINTEDMSNGIYFLNLKINNSRISKKIVLLR